MEVTEQTHQGRVEALTELIVDVCDRASREALELSEDGAQPHLVAALSSAEAALRAESSRLAASTRAREHDQQSLAV